ncbi:MAG: UMP kinase [Holosporaceae bacterium]|jgi:uridylate kinase|nr:UMP kinase [Holosporaceae bacterium]
MDRKYHRILLKISGEFLMGDLDFGLDVKTIDRIANEVSVAHSNGYEICIVIGGGNIFRGVSAASYGMHRAAADNIGMLATVMNSVAFQNSLEKFGVSSRVMSAIVMPTVCEPYVRRKALRHMEKRRVVICAAGSGNPYFTTDTAAALRALEIGCDVIMKATKVQGVYTSDPEKSADAQFMEKISYREVIEKDIRVMDHTAISLARENKIPIIVFSIKEEGNLCDVLSGNGHYSTIVPDDGDSSRGKDD